MAIAAGMASAATPAAAVAAAAAEHAAAPRSFHGTLALMSLPVADPADSLYRLGREAITAGSYRRAATLLDQVATQYPASKSAGDALYWRAWALHRIGVDGRSTRDLADAIAALDRQEKEYPNAATIVDARALRSTIRAAQASLGDSKAAGDVAVEAKALQQQSACTGSDADAEMRTAAMDGLLTMSAADAVPILRDVLKQRDDCRIDLRKKAVFIIAQKRGNDIIPTLLDVARTDPSNAVRGEAVFWLSQSQGDAAVPALDSIMFRSTDEALRKKAIFALSQHHSEQARAAIRRVAEDEHMSRDMRGEAIFWLGQAGADDLDFFKNLYRKTADTELRKKIVFSVSQRGSPAATAWLLEMARDKSFDSDSRKDAIFWLSQRRAIDLDALQAIYNEAKGNDEIQKQVLFVFSQRSDSAAVDKLMAIAKSDGDIGMRKQAVFWLSQKNDPRVKQFLLDLLRK
jgi:HEAT repeat protein